MKTEFVKLGRYGETKSCDFCMDASTVWAHFFPNDHDGNTVVCAQCLREILSDLGYEEDAE